MPIKCLNPECELPLAVTDISCPYCSHYAPDLQDRRFRVALNSAVELLIVAHHQHLAPPVLWFGEGLERLQMALESLTRRIETGSDLRKGVPK